MGRRRGFRFAAAAVIVAAILWQVTGDRPVAKARHTAREILNEAHRAPPPPPLLAASLQADGDPQYDTRAAWRSPLLHDMARMHLAETAPPGPPTLGLHLRKLLVALLVDLSASREDILNAYIASTYFGRGCYGADAAARGYFGIDLARTTEAQQLALAPLPRRPSRLDSDPEGHQTSVSRTLTRLGEAGILPASEVDRLGALPPADPRPGLRCAPVGSLPGKS